MTSGRIWKIGCLGAARIAPGALVQPAQICGAAELTAVAARDIRRGRKFAREHGFAIALSSYEDVIQHPDIDLIYNPLPIDLHAEWTIRALEAGKHVLCEKPFAMNAGEAENMIAAARRCDKRVIEAFHYRYHPAFEQALKWLYEDRIGAVRHIEAAFNTQIPEKGGAEIRHQAARGGGAFMDLGCYPVSWMLAVMNEAPQCESASATLTERGVDESMNAQFIFGNGVTANLSASMAMAQNFEAWLKIFGEHDVIEFINPLLPHKGSRLILHSAPSEPMPIDPATTYTHQLRAVLAALSSGDELPTEGSVILKQQKILDDVYAAAGLAHLRVTGVQNQ